MMLRFKNGLAVCVVVFACSFFLFPNPAKATVCIVNSTSGLECKPFPTGGSGNSDSQCHAEYDGTYGAANVNANNAANCGAWTAPTGPPPPPAPTSTTSSTVTTPALPTINLENPLGSQTSIPLIIGNALKAIMAVLGAITLFVFVYGAWNWITAGGYPQRVQQGMQTMLFAVVGLFVIFAAYGILNTFINVLTQG